MLISQDRLKAIDAGKIDFYYISPDKNIRGKYTLHAKSPKSPDDSGYYDFLILFEHEDVEVVKAVMKFLLAVQITTPDDFILTVDLPDLEKFGFEKFMPVLSKP